MGGRLLCGAGIAILANVSASLGAEEEPHWPVHRMCAAAEGIVAGERVGATTVRIDEWLLQPTVRVPAAGREIEIAGLDEHSRILRRSRLGGPARSAGRSMLHSQRLICFIERKGVAWYALGAARDGSAGLIWLEEGECYRYHPQELREELWPTGWSLDPARADRTETALRGAIARGLADRRKWERVLEIAHPAEQAVVLASYLLERTSPEGAEATYRDSVRQFLPKLGAAGVRELIVLLETAQPDDDLGPAVTVLGDFGTLASPAMPLVTALLSRPAQSDPALVLEALGRIGDPSVAPEVLAFLDHRDLPVRAAAAKALAAFRYQDAAGDIAGSLPEGVTHEDAWYIYVMLSALKDLDGARAAVCTKKYIGQPAMVHVRDLLEPLLGR